MAADVPAAGQVCVMFCPVVMVGDWRFLVLCNNTKLLDMLRQIWPAAALRT